MKILDIVKKSLEAVAELDYPNYEVIIVDNGSTDGSYQEVKNIAEKLPVDKKVIRLERNLGFTGGNNIAYKARDPGSKYVVLLNNDAIPLQSSLRELVEYMESMRDVGAAQGVIINLETGLIDTSGGILTELLVVHQLYQGLNPHTIKKAFYVTYADGAYSIYNVEALKKATGYEDKIFYDEMFAYYDDCLLGLELWNTGFKVVSYPIVTSLHSRSSTFKRVKPLQLYLATRNYTVLNEVSNSKYKLLIRSIGLRRRVLLRTLLLGIFPSMASIISGSKVAGSAREVFRMLHKAYMDGIKLGGKILRERSTLIDLYRAPLIREAESSAVFKLLTGLGIDYLRRSYAVKISMLFERELYKYEAVA
ncbi:MAG: glycosyltransferase family 2 protein [Desulfurococcus sp.]|nr:glycosyltransferase family 2 protein [Desulfurococcus sp.]